jgi:hypothetical protein
MELRDAKPAPCRMITYRYMTYEELAVMLRSTPKQAHQLALRIGWNQHADRTGRPRVSVPDSFIQAKKWAAAPQSFHGAA